MIRTLHARLAQAVARLRGRCPACLGRGTVRTSEDEYCRAHVADAPCAYCRSAR